MTRNMIVAGNWKMNLGLAAASKLASSIDSREYPETEVAVFPPFPWLLPVKDALENSTITLGAQNSYLKQSGAFTGEVSPAMIAEICSAVLAGHSERRHILGESNALVGQKVSAASTNNLRVFLCVGELLEQRESGSTESVLTEQLQTGLVDITLEEMPGIVIAYEPVWAIGTGVPATSNDAQAMCAFIRHWIRTTYSHEVADVTPILYGGSVTGDNAHELFLQPDIDGALVGGASLNAAEFNKIIAAAALIKSV